MSARLVFVGLRVRDVDAAARFYREAFDVDVLLKAEVQVGLAPMGELGFVVDDLAARTRGPSPRGPRSSGSRATVRAPTSTRTGTSSR